MQKVKKTSGKDPCRLYTCSPLSDFEYLELRKLSCFRNKLQDLAQLLRIVSPIALFICLLYSERYCLLLISVVLLYLGKKKEKEKNFSLESFNNKCSIKTTVLERIPETILAFFSCNVVLLSIRTEGVFFFFFSSVS